MNKKRLLYINIPSMKCYRGAIRGVDVPSGGFRYTLEKPFNDHTQFNFQPYDGKYYGHVPGSTRPNLRRLGGGRHVKFVDNVTVVWIATDPDSDDRVVVGWYGNARVWKERRRPKAGLARQRKTEEGDICEYSVEAARGSSHLLRPGERPPLFSRKGARKDRPGQNPYWYGNPRANGRVLRIIDRSAVYGRRSTNRGDAKGADRTGLQNTAERLEIEQRAMTLVRRIYEQDRYDVHDKSAQKLGYDFLAISESSELHLEVKGKKGADVHVELTPNEYKFARRNRASFRVCVVVNALKSSRRMLELQYHKGDWIDREGRKFSGEERPGLVISG